MTRKSPSAPASPVEKRPEVLAWLLDSDPAIRWQVRQDLLGEPPELVSRERARVATEGWGARLLALQGSDGQWGGGPYHPCWTGTTSTLLLLKEMGLDPHSDPARAAIELVRDKAVWEPEFDSAPFFEGEVEPCINGGVLAAGAYFGAADERLLRRLLGEQLEDGGWNCEAPGSNRSSFHTTLCVLEGLLAHEQTSGASAQVTEARLRGQDYLLERRLFRSKTTGKVINPAWLQLAFPTRWHYDVLGGLDYLRRAGTAPDDRLAEAVALVREKQDADGRWPLEHFHPGDVHFSLDDGIGRPSRWNTLRALRVLDWFDAARG